VWSHPPCTDPERHRREHECRTQQEDETQFRETTFTAYSPIRPECLAVTRLVGHIKGRAVDAHQVPTPIIDPTSFLSSDRTIQLFVEALHRLKDEPGPRKRCPRTSCTTKPLDGPFQRLKPLDQATQHLGVSDILELPRFGGLSFTCRGSYQEIVMLRTRVAYSLKFRHQIVELFRSGRTFSELSEKFEPSREMICNCSCHTSLSDSLKIRAGKEFNKTLSEQY